MTRARQTKATPKQPIPHAPTEDPKPTNAPQSPQATRAPETGPPDPHSMTRQKKSRKRRKPIRKIIPTDACQQAPKINHHPAPPKETPRNRIIPAITGGHIGNDTERKPPPLPTRPSEPPPPTRPGEPAIPTPHEQVTVEYSYLRKLTPQLAPLIKIQNKQYTVDKSQIKITKQVIKKRKARSMPLHRRSIKK